MDSKVRKAAERLIKLGELLEELPINDQYSGDLLLVARAVLVAGDEISRLREALAGVERCKLWLDEDCRAGTAIEALAASGTTSTPTCDACGLPITEDYVETVIEGDEGAYHMGCAPLGAMLRTVLIP